MKLLPKIHLTVSKKEFRFSNGSNEHKFSPVVHLSRERKILAVGEPPTQGDVAEVVRIFDDASREKDPMALLEAMMRFGLRQQVGRLSVGPISLRITIDAELRQFLRGFAPTLFYTAALHAGASKIVVDGL